MAYKKSIWTSSWIIKIIEPIIIPEIQKQKKVRSLFIIFLILWLHFEYTFMVKQHLLGAMTCPSTQCRKVVLMFFLWDLCLGGMWYSLTLRRASVKKLLKKYRLLYNCHDVIPTKSKIIINIATFAYLLVFIVIKIAMMTVFIVSDDVATKWHEDIKLFSSGPVFKRIVLFIHIVSKGLIETIFPGMMSLFHIAQFTALCHAISHAGRKLKFKTRYDVENFIQMYSNVYKLATSVESTVSLEMFFISCYQYLMMYVWISNFFRPAQLDIVQQMWLTFQVILILLYVIKVVIASEINNRDSTLRDKIKELVFEMSLSGRTRSCADMLNRFMDSKRVITFTAFRMFSFTRSFLITSVGVLFTYSLLILQLSIPDERNPP